MARTNVYANISSQNRNYDVSIGGRGRCDYINAWFNTDTAFGEASASFKVESGGDRRHLDKAPRKVCHYCDHEFEHATWASGMERCPDCGNLRQGASTLEAYFTLDLPEAGNKAVHVEIRRHGSGMRALAAFGAMLVGIKGMSQLADPDPSVANNGEYLIEQAAEIMKSLETKMEDVPENVTVLGYNLRHLIACKMMVDEMLKEQERRKDTNQN